MKYTVAIIIFFFLFVGWQIFVLEYYKWGKLYDFVLKYGDTLIVIDIALYALMLGVLWA